MTDPDLKKMSQYREQLFIDLYKRCFPAVARYVSKMGGNLEQARDVFQDALVAYYEKTRRQSFVLSTDENAYLFGISKNLWTRRYKAGKITTPLKEGIEPEVEEQQQASAAKIGRYLAAAGQKCMELLRAFYYDQHPLEDIAGAFGFSGTRSATVQKYKCLEKVREKVKEKSLTYADFLE